MLGFYVDKEWLLRNNHHGPRLNKYDHTLKLIPSDFQYDGELGANGLTL